MAGPTVAVVGSGPSGCYTAQSLLRSLPTARISILERLPVPFGLLRYGVAADHQSTKTSAIAQFERLLADERVTFMGNVELGSTVTLEQLSTAFDVVVLATGADQDGELAVPGSDVEGVVGAGALTRWMNDHPHAQVPAPMTARKVAIVGHGNVALDLVRLLSKTEAELKGSDLAADKHRVLAHGLRSIDVIGRSPAAVAKFDVAMIRELGKLQGVGFRLQGVAADEPESPRLTALRQLPGPAEHDRLIVTFWFQATPVQLLGQERVAGMVLRNRDGDQTTLDVDAVVTAIGFPAPVRAPAEDAADGVYRVGWCANGSVGGGIPAARTQAKQITQRIVADLAEAAGHVVRPGASALPVQVTREATGLTGWRAIDAEERARAHPERVRAKISEHAALLSLAASAVHASRSEPSVPPEVEECTP